MATPAKPVRSAAVPDLPRDVTYARLVGGPLDGLIVECDPDAETLSLTAFGAFRSGDTGREAERAGTPPVEYRFTGRLRRTEEGLEAEFELGPAR